MKQWQIVYSTRLYTEAAIIQGKLQMNEIPVHLLNKQDSMYNIAIGDFELYVPMHFQHLALAVIYNTLKN